MDAKVLLRNEGRELYSDAEMAELQKVIRAFYNYLRDSRRCELLWSEKLGYVFLRIDSERRSIELESIVIRTAEGLVNVLLDEIAMDIAQEERQEALTVAEHSAFQRRIHDYMTQLPEYQHCVEEVLAS